MSRKRGNNEGTVFQRKDGKWCAAVSVPLATGKSKRVYHYGKTRKECLAWKTEMLSQLRKGAISVDSDMSLIDWLRNWMSEYCVNIRDSTRMNYETYILRHISKSSISSVPINRLTTHDLQEYCNSLCQSGRLDGKGGLNAKTVRNLFHMIHAALKQAVGNGLILSNPAEYIVLPKTRKTDAVYLDLKQQQTLLAACKDERWYIGVLISLETGVRLGELLALRRSDIKCDDGIYYLDIRRSLQRVTDFEHKRKDGRRTILREGNPKSENSERKIPLSPALKKALYSFFTQQDDRAATHRVPLLADPYIISNEKGGFIDPTTYRNWFKERVSVAGLSDKVTPHKLRHTFASTCLRYGMNLKTISSLLGHYSTDFTAKTYVHTDLEGQYEEILNMVNKKEEILPC